jgi:hypothetical protein
VIQVTQGPTRTTLSQALAAAAVVGIPAVALALLVVRAVLAATGAVEVEVAGQRLRTLVRPLAVLAATAGDLNSS